MTYELYYWSHIQGRGEFVRLALEQAGAGRTGMAREPGDAGPGVAPIPAAGERRAGAGCRQRCGHQWSAARPPGAISHDGWQSSRTYRQRARQTGNIYLSWAGFPAHTDKFTCIHAPWPAP